MIERNQQPASAVQDGEQPKPHLRLRYHPSYGIWSVSWRCGGGMVCKSRLYAGSASALLGLRLELARLPVSMHPVELPLARLMHLIDGR